MRPDSATGPFYVLVAMAEIAASIADLRRWYMTAVILVLRGCQFSMQGCPFRCASLSRCSVPNPLEEEC